VQWFTVAFNFLCVLLGLLYEGGHLSLSVRRQIMLTFFIQRLQTFFYFCHVFYVFNVLLFRGERFFHLWPLTLPLSTRQLNNKNSSADEIANVNFFYDDIVHVEASAYAH